MPKILIVLAIMLSSFATLASAGQWDGAWIVHVNTKHAFDLPFTVDGTKVTVTTFGKSQATAVSKAQISGSTLQFTVVFMGIKGGKCGSGSKATLTIEHGKKGKWKYYCAGKGSGTAKTGVASPA